MRNRFRLCEDTRPQKLPVFVSSKIKQRIAEIYKHNQNNPTALGQWSEYIEGLKSYISNPVIAFDYTNRYVHFPNGAIHLVEMNYDVSFITKSNDANEYVYVYLFNINFNLGEFGLKEHKITKNKQNNIMKNTNKVKLTERQLHSIIKESVKTILKEKYILKESEDDDYVKYKVHLDWLSSEIALAAKEPIKREMKYGDDWAQKHFLYFAISLMYGNLPDFENFYRIAYDDGSKGSFCGESSMGEDVVFKLMNDFYETYEKFINTPMVAKMHKVELKEIMRKWGEKIYYYIMKIVRGEKEKRINAWLPDTDEYGNPYGNY